MEKIQISNENLLKKTSVLVTEERRITAQLLECFSEIETRRLHLEMGFGSMFDFLTKHFHYSEGAASRRIAAMRLSKEVPSLVKSIETGKLTLSTASQVHYFLQNEKKNDRPYTPEEKNELTAKMENRSRRDCERELLKLSPTSVIAKERERPLTPTETELRIVANAELMEKLQKLRALLAHHGNLGYAELIDKLADQALRKLDPSYSASPAIETPSIPQNREPAPDIAPDTLQRTASPPAKLTQPSEQKAPGRYIPAADRRAIWQRAQGCCEFIDSKSGRRCSSRWALEIDHIHPVARGGTNESANLRVLCRQHNSWAAIQAFGLPLMSKYLRK